MVRGWMDWRRRDLEPLARRTIAHSILSCGRGIAGARRVRLRASVYATEESGNGCPSERNPRIGRVGAASQTFIRHLHSVGLFDLHTALFLFCDDVDLPDRA